MSGVQHVGPCGQICNAEPEKLVKIVLKVLKWMSGQESLLSASFARGLVQSLLWTPN